LLNLGGGSMAIRIAIVVIGVVVLMILIIVASSLLSGSGNVPNLTIVAEDQNEIARVATIANNNASNISQATTSNFAQACALSVTSAQQQLVSFLGQHGTKLSTGTLAKKQNPSSDQALNAAITSSTFDQTFLNIMQTELSGYASDLKKAYAGAQNSTEKQLISNDYQDEQLLAQQLSSAQSALNNADN
jgi:hypothetical protein